MLSKQIVLKSSVKDLKLGRIPYIASSYANEASATLSIKDGVMTVADFESEVKVKVEAEVLSVVKERAPKSLKAVKSSDVKLRPISYTVKLRAASLKIPKKLEPEETRN